MINFLKMLGCLVMGLAMAVPAAAYDAPKAAAPAAKAADRPAQVLFQNVNIFNGKNEKLISNANVLVEGNKITKIANSIPV